MCFDNNNRYNNSQLDAGYLTLTIKTYGTGVQASSWDDVTSKKKSKIEKDMKDMAIKITKCENVSIPIITKLMFMMFANIQKANMGSGPTERVYWEKQGWLEKGRPWK